VSQLRVAIVTDSTCDIPPTLTSDRGITVIPLTITVRGRSYLDGVEIRPEQLYEQLSREGATATTSQPSPGQFAEAYRRLLEDHEQILSIHITERLSGTLAAASQAAAEVGGDRVHVLDSGLVSMPLGLAVLAARTFAEEGPTAAEIAERLRPILGAIRVYFMVASLEHLRRGGRIGRASALVGSVLQVKPVLTLQDGQVAPLERVRTKDRALARVIELAAGDGGRLCAFIGHAAAEASGMRIAEALEPRAETLIVGQLGPTVGAHAGPGTVGVACYPAELCPLGLRLVASDAQLVDS
jgi:DegV family protein with EDD domain